MTSRDIDDLFLVNSVAWAPHELGAMLACASSDGKISVLEYRGKRKKAPMVVLDLLIDAL